MATYTVKKDDNLSVIAEKYGLTWQDLYAANKKAVGSNPDLIHAGLKLTIPGTEKKAAKPAAKQAPKPTVVKPAGMTPSQTSAWTDLQNVLNQWGLSSLNSTIKSLIQSGASEDEALIKLRDSDAYKKRFAGNQLLIKNGMAPLDEASYLATERSYETAARAYGLPSGFYDSPDDFSKLIGAGVSADEYAARVKVAHDQYEAADAKTKALWQTYGYSKGDAIAAILDPTVGTQIILDRANTVAIGGAAADAGFTLSKDRATTLYQHGVDLDTARKAYADIAQRYATDQNIGARFGTTVNQAMEENASLSGDAAATNTINRLYGQEQALFRGSAGVNENTFGSGNSDY